MFKSMNEECVHTRHSATTKKKMDPSLFTLRDVAARETYTSLIVCISWLWCHGNSYINLNRYHTLVVSSCYFACSSSSVFNLITLYKKMYKWDRRIWYIMNKYSEKKREKNGKYYWRESFSRKASSETCRKTAKVRRDRARTWLSGILVGDNQPVRLMWRNKERSALAAGFRSELCACLSQRVREELLALIAKYNQDPDYEWNPSPASSFSLCVSPHWRWSGSTSYWSREGM